MTELRKLTLQNKGTRTGQSAKPVSEAKIKRLKNKASANNRRLIKPVESEPMVTMMTAGVPVNKLEAKSDRSLKLRKTYPSTKFDEIKPAYCRYTQKAFNGLTRTDIAEMLLSGKVS